MAELLTFLQNEYIRKLDCRLRFLLDKFSINQIVTEIINWLQNEELNYFDTTTFARDFFIGSDLTNNEKTSFYNELKNQGFFELISHFLTSSNFSVCSWTIYTFGKFSIAQNAAYLEKAYIENYSKTNPILSYRCLNELNWLSSKMENQFLSELELSNSKTSKLILIYYYETQSENVKYNRLLSEKELLHFISPKHTPDKKNKEVSERLFDFEIYISDLYNNNDKIDLSQFEYIAENFFKNYTRTENKEAEKEHQEFLKRFNEK